MFWQSGVIPAAKAAAPQAAAPKVAAAEQKTSDLIFQAPKVGPIKLCPDDLLAVYHPQTQGVILVTRKQYDQVGKSMIEWILCKNYNE